jgi:WD40 repeat protein
MFKLQQEGRSVKNHLLQISVFAIALMLTAGIMSLMPIVTWAQVPSPDEISSTAWSPNGEMIAGAGNNGFLRIWDANTDQVVHDFQGLTGALYSVIWSPDSARIASAGDDKMIRIWDANTEQLLATLQGHLATIDSLSWSPDGTKLASVSFSGDSGDNSLRIWDVINYQPMAQRNAGTLNAVAWNPNPSSNEIAVASENGYVGVYQLTPTEIPPPRMSFPFNAPAMSVAWNGDGTRLASGYDDGTIILSDAATGNPIATFTGHTDLVGALAWSPDDTRLASASNDGTIRFWDVAIGQTLAVIPNEKITISNTIAWSPDGTQLAYGGADGTVEIVPAPAPNTPTATSTATPTNRATPTGWR